MGNSKLLIIAISVLSAMALICVSAFAEDLIPEINFPPFEQGEIVDFDLEVRDVETGSDTAAPFNIFEFSTYVYDINLSQLPYVSPYFVGDYFNVYITDAYESFYTLVCSGSGSDNVIIYRATSDGVPGIVYGSAFIPIPDFTNWSNYRITVFSDSSSLPLVSGNYVDGVLYEEEPVNDLWDTIRGVGNSIITFVMSSWVVLVPVVAFVLVLGITVIRRLTNGV